jgi:hypothetical protein
MRYTLSPRLFGLHFNPFTATNIFSPLFTGYRCSSRAYAQEEVKGMPLAVNAFSN